MNLLAESGNVPLSAWQTFYEIIGSSAGALVGLQFLGIALIASTRKQTSVEPINAFGTPNVVHFAGTLSISAIMTAPWPWLVGPTIAIAVCGLGGLGYTAIVFRRARRQTEYKPVAEDWFWYVIMPCGMYAALTIGALLLRTVTRVALFVVAGAALGLLLVGIRNAWDTVTFIAVSGDTSDAKKPE